MCVPWTPPGSPQEAPVTGACGGDGQPPCAGGVCNEDFAVTVSEVSVEGVCAPAVPVQIENFRIFRTIFWVSLREN